MPLKATTRRVPVALEEPLYDTLVEVAERDRLSISAKARDLIRHALEIEEDSALEALVSIRMRNEAAAIPHDTFWKEIRRRRRIRGR